MDSPRKRTDPHILAHPDLVPILEKETFLFYKESDGEYSLFTGLPGMVTIPVYVDPEAPKGYLQTVNFGNEDIQRLRI